MIGSTNCKKVIEQIHYIEYIQSNGTQYIDTGFSPNQDTRVVIDIEPLIDDTLPYFGSRVAQNQTSYVLWEMSSTQIRYDYATGPITQNVNNVLKRTLIDYNKNTLNFNNETTLNHATATFQLNYSIHILGCNQGGSPEGRMIRAKLYSCQIYDNGTLIRDYLPTLDKSGVACLYDKINKQYVYNSGTGNFITP